MARHIQDFRFSAPNQTVYNAICQYLQSEGFVNKIFEGENVFQKGTGWLTAPVFFKFFPIPGGMRMETWMKFAWLPGVYSGEMGPTGFWGWAVKITWRERISRIEGIVQQFAGPVQQPAYQQPVQAPVYQQPVYQQPVQQPAAGGFCSQCGSPLKPGAGFCVNCGKKL